MKPDPDDDLRERFSELREHHDVAAPAFDGVLMRAPAQTHRTWPALAWTAGGFVAAMAVGLVLWPRPPEPASDAEMAALPAWPRQTDFLLAGASDSQRLVWSPTPTSELGQPSFSRYQEGK